MENMRGDIEESKLPLLKDYILLNKFGLMVLGIWPLSDDAPKWRVALRQVHITVMYCLLLALLIPQMLDLYILWGNIEANAENLCTSLTTITVFAKLSNMVAMRHSWKAVLTNMRENWETIMRAPVPKEHRELLLQNAEVARNFTRNYCVIMYTTASMYFLLPIIIGLDVKTAHAKQYPFCAWYYYDEFSYVYYGLFYFSQVVIGFCCGTGNYTLDSLFLVTVSHACAQIQILQRELRMLGTNKDPSEHEGDPVRRDAAISDREVTEKMKHLIRMHEKHIQNARKLAAVFNGASLQQLLVSCFLICVIGFQLMVSIGGGGNTFQTIKYVAYMHLVLIQIYLYCRAGDQLMNQSLAIGTAAYQCPWPELPLPVTRCLLLLTMRSQRPLTITAGKFFVMSMYNFALILKTSLSYLSVLRAMYDDNYN